MTQAVQPFVPRRNSNAPGQGSSLVDLTTTDATISARELYVVGAGDVKFKGMDGNDDTWTVPANFYMRVAVQKIYKTGTTATGIHAIV